MKTAKDFTRKYTLEVNHQELLCLLSAVAQTGNGEIFDWLSENDYKLDQPITGESRVDTPLQLFRELRDLSR